MALDFSTAALESVRHWNNDLQNTKIFNLEFCTRTKEYNQLQLYNQLQEYNQLWQKSTIKRVLINCGGK